MSKKKYFKMLGKHKDFIMADPNQFDDKIKKEFLLFQKLTIKFFIEIIFLII